MTNRSQDLTADLLRDLQSEDPTPPAAPPPPSDRPLVEAGLYLAPRSWRPPGVRRQDGTLALTVGPVRVRIGRLG